MKTILIKRIIQLKKKDGNIEKNTIIPEEKDSNNGRNKSIKRK